jgi:hypothetical protein
MCDAKMDNAMLKMELCVLKIDVRAKMGVRAKDGCAC